MNVIDLQNSWVKGVYNINAEVASRKPTLEHNCGNCDKICLLKLILGRQHYHWQNLRLTFLAHAYQPPKRVREDTGSPLGFPFGKVN